MARRSNLLLLLHFLYFFAALAVTTVSTVSAATEGKRESIHPSYLYKNTELETKLFGSFDALLNPVIRAILDKVNAKNNDKNVLVTHHMIPMRDGVKLSTFVLHPSLNDGKKRSTMMGRSPYGPTSDQLADLYILANDHVAVIQDQRGTFLSEGEFSMWQKDGEDGFDTIEWISKQAWSNGKVYSAGISADGCGAGAMILHPNSKLRGQVLMWSSTNAHRTSYPGGAFREGLVSGWMSLMSTMTKGKSFTRTLPDILNHEVLDEWWKEIEGPGHYQNVKWPTIVLSAWWDIFQGESIELFNGIRENSKEEATLVVGPLGHCMLGNLNPHLALEEAKGIVNGLGYSTELFSKDEENGDAVANGFFAKKMNRLNLYIQGADYWTSLPEWPKKTEKKFFLSNSEETGLVSHEDGSVSDKKSYVLLPEEKFFAFHDEVNAVESRRRSLRNDNARVKSYVEYLYDPKVAPGTHGGNNLILTFLGFGCASMKQNKLETRSDGVVFTLAEAFEEDVNLVGRFKAVLHVSTNKKDTDFYVSINDVHEDGSSYQIRFGLQRMKFRASTQFATVVSETLPNVIYKIEVDMDWSAFTIKKGHKLRVLVNSANTPYYAKNDNSGKDELGFKYEIQASNRIYLSQDFPSYVELPIVDKKDIPKNELF